MKAPILNQSCNYASNYHENLTTYKFWQFEMLWFYFDNNIFLKLKEGLNTIQFRVTLGIDLSVVVSWEKGL